MAMIRAPVVAQPIAPPRISILTAGQFDTGMDAHIFQGFTFQPEACGGDGGVFPICDTTPPTKNSGVRGADIDGEGFVVYEVDTCSAFGFGAADYVARARRKLEACQATHVEAELWGSASELVATNQHLNDTAEDLGAAESMAVGLACLEDYLADCACGGRGMIHMSRGMALLASRDGLVRREGSLILTINDTIIVPGGGYPSTGGQMYASSLVAGALGPVEVFGGVAEMDRTLNTVETRAERAVAYWFDPCCLAGMAVPSAICPGS